MSLSSLNPFSNPIVIKCARERLRPRNAISWGIVVTVVTGFWFRLVANWFRMGAKFDLMAERPTSKETSLGMSSFRRLSVVWLTATPVPTVALSIAAFWSCIFLDQI